MRIFILLCVIPLLVPAGAARAGDSVELPRNLGVDVTGLKMIQGRKLSLLYGTETVKVQHWGISTRLQGYEVKLFATNSRYESSRTAGRDYPAN